MDHAVLVEMDVQAARSLIEVLDEQKVEVSVLLLAVFADYYSPRLVVSAPWLESPDPRVNYREFGEALRRVGVDLDPTVDLMILKREDPFVREVRRIFVDLENKRGYRIGSRSFGNRFVEDGYVFRVR